MGRPAIRFWALSRKYVREKSETLGFAGVGPTVPVFSPDVISVYSSGSLPMMPAGLGSENSRQ